MPEAAGEIADEGLAFFYDRDESAASTAAGGEERKGEIVSVTNVVLKLKDDPDDLANGAISLLSSSLRNARKNPGARYAFWIADCSDERGSYRIEVKFDQEMAGPEERVI